MCDTHGYNMVETEPFPKNHIIGELEGKTVGLMLSQQELFAGTPFSPQLQTAIYKDITQLVSLFPTVLPYRYQGPNGVSVLIQGTVTIQLNGQNTPMPINIMIPNGFPNAVPIAQIPQTPGKIIIPSYALQPDGIILVDRFYRWVPRQSTLPLFMYSVIQYFSNNPPFQQQGGTMPATRPTQAPQQAVVSEEIIQVGVATAESLIDTSNRTIADAHKVLLDEQMTKHMIKIINKIDLDITKQNASLEAKLAQFQNQPLPEVPIDQTVAINAKRDAADKAFKETIEHLRRQFHDNNVTADDLIKTIREMSRDHFKNDIAPYIS